MHAELKALVSLHDVMPETLPMVRAVLDKLRCLGIPPVPLLVVPGKHWEEAQLEELREWASAGHEMVAHGWRHRAAGIRGAYHRLHSLLISRDVAEHLSLSSEEVAALMQRSIEWFPQRGLPTPAYYVPPAWALGTLPLDRMDSLTRRSLPLHVEVLNGFLNTRTGHLDRLPLVGCEVDSFAKTVFVRNWNRMQIRASIRSGRPLRIGLHPQDFDLPLAGQLQSIISRPDLTWVPVTRYLNQ